ncbi:hypothetical protein MBSD_n1485 [Mizugakiibacter sediminis]|uniref:Uncharacterized protein n=1 Tax=Mizugakiibacter sediminis TaxID=1475481 RepID=A0A0K8QP40_9GAMM|nr:hypothetical protein [Mizugakiibacter sediminis]GAP66182.1 hypothetical protein MBSD_n1485 [Mizugakiibacter sediminis]
MAKGAAAKKAHSASKKGKRKGKAPTPERASYPRHSLDRVLRIPRAIIDQNAGRDCSEQDAAGFVGIGYGGPFRLEISSAIKFGLLDRPTTGRIAVTELARRAIRPQSPGDDTKALQEAVLKAPQVAEVYEHYRGENLPDRNFFENALEDKFGIPRDKIPDFISVFEQSLEVAKLVQRVDDRARIIDVTESVPGSDEQQRLRRISKDVKVASGDSCFVMMPFVEPIGAYYEKIYAPAIRKAGLEPVRADTEIFGTGKIIDQIWSGINAARVLVAELTTRNPNVFYELGLAHALQKPVVLVAGTEDDVPFDLRHIRVIYYDMRDPFWGQKLLDKVSENILSALKNPEEAILPRGLSQRGSE